MSEIIPALARYRQLTVTMVTVVPMVSSVPTTICVQGEQFRRKGQQLCVKSLFK